MAAIKMANYFTLILILGSGHSIQASPTVNQTLVSLDQTALTALLIPFREAILHRVAVDWNHTITDSERLQNQSLVCSGQIKATVRTCEYCTEAACKGTETVSQVTHSATFTDYLKFAASLLNPYTFLKEPLKEVGDKFGDLKDLLGDGSDAFIDSMASLGKSVGGKFSDAFESIEHAFNSFGDNVKDLGNTAIGGIKDVAGSVGDGLHNVGDAFEHLGHSIKDGIGHIFGRRDASSLDPHIRQCMAQCASCDPLLLPARRDLVSKICGSDLVRFNDTVRANVVTIKNIYVAVADKAHPIITEIKYDTASTNGILISRIFVTANVHGHYVTYQSNVKYNMMNIGITAQELALEYWSKWTG